MSEHIEKTIAALNAQIRAQQDLVNGLCLFVGRPPLHAFAPEPELAANLKFLELPTRPALAAPRRRGPGKKSKVEKPAPGRPEYGQSQAAVRALLPSLPATFRVRDVVELNPDLKAESVSSALKVLAGEKALHVNTPGRAGVATVFGKPGAATKPAPVARQQNMPPLQFGKAEAKPKPVVRPEPVAPVKETLALTARLAGVKGEAADQAVLRTVRRLPSTFTRLELDEFCPAGFSGLEIGQAIGRLRGEKLLAFADYQPNPEVSTYERGPEWKGGA